MIRKYRGLIVLLCIAFLVRIGLMLLATEFREHPDILRWKDWGRISYLYGFADTYSSTHLSFGTYPNNMPPGTLYLVSGAYRLWLMTGRVLSLFGIAPGSNQWVNVILLQLFLKLPSIAADLFIAIIIYALIFEAKKEEKQALLGASLFLFNPVVLFNSAFWGQMDAINNVFFLLALWLLIKKHYSRAAAAFTVSLLIKFSLIFALPLMLCIAVWGNNRWKQTLVGMTVAAMLMIALFVLPISRDIGWYPQYLMGNATGEMTNITAFAFNAWWVVFHPTLAMGSSRDLTKVVDIWLTNAPLTQMRIGPVSLGMISLSISLLIQGAVYLWFVKRKPLAEGKHIIAMGAVLAIVSFLTLPQMHERYLYPAIAPLAILVGFGIPLGNEFLLLSLLNLGNLIAVWHPMPMPIWMFDVMKNTWWQWSMAVGTLVVGLLTVKKILSNHTL